jgi:hypothetical protein
MEYFWYHRPGENFPPPVVRDPTDAASCARLCIACTQTTLSASQQAKSVHAWCEVLPTLDQLRFLWLSSRVPQVLFDAACHVPNLEGLWIKWSGVQSIEAITVAKSLQFFHLGSSSRLTSIESLTRMAGLRWLGLENVKRITHLDPISPLTQLEGLTVEGSMWTPQRVTTLSPISALRSLRYLSIANLRADDRTLSPLYSLTKLEVLRIAQWWDNAELREIERRHPQLRIN